METVLTQQQQPAEGRGPKLNFFQRYRDFLLSRDTIIACINALLLLLGFILTLFGASTLARWFFLGSAMIGGIPLFLLAAKAVFIRRDITAGFMASVAMIAAILVGEYSAAALVVLMFAVGDWLENLTIARADNALKDLARLVPATVWVIQGGKEVAVAVELLQQGNLVLVRSGERIAIDGKVLNGSGSVNQSAITGESLPVEKQVGDDVFAGTLNEVGAMEIEVSRIGQDTTLGQIVRLVKEAQKTQAPVQRIANQYARILVPITFGIAALVYLLTGDITRSITVLVVVCPCALVLATPTAVVAAIGNAARQGILVKSGAVIEQIGKVDVVAFDKTGTLTTGRPAVRAVLPFNGMREDQVLALAASLERESEHPIGRAIVQASQERRLPALKASSSLVLPGLGLTGMVGAQQLAIGKKSLLVEHGVTWSSEVDAQVQQLEAQGHTVIAVAVDGLLGGVIALADTPREHARQAIAELKRIGIREVIMITGDNRRLAERMAAELGIDQVFADVLPQDKLNIIRALQKAGKKVAFIGDGVNDAPALAAAEIGIAMGVGGTDVALETADIGLMTDDIAHIPAIIELSRRALGVIRQNVMFSMSMNVLSVALGGFGIIGPVLGALMHETSALPVLANSARLIQFKNVVK